MDFQKLKIPDVILIKPKIHEDFRGYFMETYHIEKFSLSGIDCSFVQDNYAKSIKNCLRGLHFQTRYPQAKLLRCVKGKIFDVVVDLRKNSTSFGHWAGIELSEDNKFQVFIPEGFAHGYYVLSETAEIFYKCSEIYFPEYEQGVLWNDQDIGIEWPCKYPILSDKDKLLPLLNKLA